MGTYHIVGNLLPRLKYHLISITKSISKILYQTLCVFLHIKDTKHIRRYFLFCHLGHAPGMGLWGAGGAQVVKKIFFKHGHVAYQIDGNDKQN